MLDISAPGEYVRHAQAYAKQTLALLRDLIRIPSVNHRDPETGVADRIKEEALRLGLQVRYEGLEPDRSNVLVSLGRGEHGFAFIGHLDTVAEGDPQAWAHPPFGAELAAGRLYGRGAADNKAGLACALYALALLRDQGWEQEANGSIILAGVVDEESGASSRLGVRYLLDQNLLPVRAAIYTYASDIVCIGHRGLVRLKLRAHGQAVHSGSREWDQGLAGVNAVTGLAAALMRLERLELDAPPHPSFEGLGQKITPGTLIKGGDWEGMVPAWAEAVVDIRTLPGQSTQDILSQIHSVIDSEISQRAGLRITIEQMVALPAAAIPPDHRLVRIAQRYTRAITGETWPARAAGPANEGYMLIEAGIPTLCGFGPSGGNVHAPDEWVETASLAPTTAMFAGIAHDYLRTEE